jgi:hypothetical protein
MSLKPTPIDPRAEETARVARAASVGAIGGVRDEAQHPGALW